MADHLPLNWTQECALAELKRRTGEHATWLKREWTSVRPNTLDALVRRGLAEATWSPNGRYATAYRITAEGLTYDLSRVESLS